MANESLANTGRTRIDTNQTGSIADGSMKSRNDSNNQSISTNFNLDDSVRQSANFWVRQPSKIPEGEYGQLDDYYIIKTIGKGGFGKVKIGFEKTTRQKYAIKIMTGKEDRALKSFN